MRPRRSGRAARRQTAGRAAQLFVQPESTGKSHAPLGRTIPGREQRPRGHAARRDRPRELQARRLEQEHHDGGAHERPERAADERAHGAIEPPERAAVRGLRQEIAPPLHQRRHAEPDEARDDPAQEQEHELRACAPPVRPDPVRNIGPGEDAQQHAGESENLRDGAAQESANHEHGQQGDEHPVEPGEMLEKRRVRLVLLRPLRQVLALGGVQLPLAPLTGLLEVLMTTEVRHDAGLLTLLLETAQGTLEGLSVLHPDAWQSYPPLS
jgi:hypothetical protein